MPWAVKWKNDTLREYNDDGYSTHSKGPGGEWWNEYDYERKRVHFISSMGYNEWHYGWPTFAIKNK